MPGRTPFGTRVRGSQGQFGINPLSLPGLELYLRSDMGILVADGATLPNWQDQSGKGRDPAQPTVANQPTYHATGALLSSKGKQVVSFDGLDSPLGDQMFGTWNNAGSAIPTDVTGMTAYFGGRWYAPVNAAGGGAIWQPASGSRPQLSNDIAPSDPRLFKIDTDFGGAAFGAAVRGLHTINWAFTPPKGVGAVVTAYVDDVARGPNFPSWGWTPQAADQYLLSGNPVGNVCCKVDLMWCLIYSDNHSAATIAGVNRFLSHIFGP